MDKITSSHGLKANGGTSGSATKLVVDTTPLDTKILVPEKPDVSQLGSTPRSSMEIVRTAQREGVWEADASTPSITNERPPLSPASGTKKTIVHRPPPSPPKTKGSLTGRRSISTPPVRPGRPAPKHTPTQENQSPIRSSEKLRVVADYTKFGPPAKRRSIIDIAKADGVWEIDDDEIESLIDTNGTTGTIDNISPIKATPDGGDSDSSVKNRIPRRSISNMKASGSAQESGVAKAIAVLEVERKIKRVSASRMAAEEKVAAAASDIKRLEDLKAARLNIRNRNNGENPGAGVGSRRAVSVNSRLTAAARTPPVTGGALYQQKKAELKHNDTKVVKIEMKPSNAVRSLKPVSLEAQLRKESYSIVLNNSSVKQKPPDQATTPPVVALSEAKLYNAVKKETTFDVMKQPPISAPLCKTIVCSSNIGKSLVTSKYKSKLLGGILEKYFPIVFPIVQTDQSKPVQECDETEPKFSVIHSKLQTNFWNVCSTSALLFYLIHSDVLVQLYRKYFVK